jgi:hypothetical protein
MAAYYPGAVAQTAGFISMRSIVFIFVFLATLQSAYGASPGERALAWSESQRDAALGAVLAARKRVEAAESDLRISRNTERDIQDSKDAAALAVIREAVTVSEQGVVEAQTLLKRAMQHLSKQEETLAVVANRWRTTVAIGPLSR